MVIKYIHFLAKINAVNCVDGARIKRVPQKCMFNAPLSPIRRQKINRWCIISWVDACVMCYALCAAQCPSSLTPFIFPTWPKYPVNQNILYTKQVDKMWPDCRPNHRPADLPDRLMTKVGVSEVPQVCWGAIQVTLKIMNWIENRIEIVLKKKFKKKKKIISPKIFFEIVTDGLYQTHTC